MRFAFLRNAIMHGDEVDPTMFEHEGRAHIWLGESRLMEAIKALVAQSGHQRFYSIDTSGSVRSGSSARRSCYRPRSRTGT